jgi:predicted class III extradiol MEMO1 family dioxygenase
MIVMEIIESIEVEEGYIRLIKNPESNVIGRGGYTVSVQLDGIVTKILNYSGYSDAEAQYEQEVEGYYDGTTEYEAKKFLGKI